MQRTHPSRHIQTSMMSRHCGIFPVRLRTVSLAAALVSLFISPTGHAMEIKALGDQLILSGRVVAGDTEAVESRLNTEPQIKMVVLRNSPGGDAPTGYHLGELFAGNRSKPHSPAIAIRRAHGCSLAARNAISPTTIRPDTLKSGSTGITMARAT
jgi:hypothetical protein